MKENKNDMYNDTERLIRSELKDDSEKKIFDGMQELYDKNFEYVYGMVEKEYRKSNYEDTYDEDTIIEDALQRTLVTSLLEVANKFQDSKVGKLNSDDELDYLYFNNEVRNVCVKDSIHLRTKEGASKAFIKDIILPTYERFVTEGHPHDTVTGVLFSLLSKADGACNEPFDIVPYYDAGDPDCNIPYRSTCVNVADGGIHEYMFPILGEESIVYQENMKAGKDNRKPLREIFNDSYRDEKMRKEKMLNPTKYYLVSGEDLIDSSIALSDINDMGLDHDKIIAGMVLNGIEFEDGDDD